MALPKRPCKLCMSEGCECCNYIGWVTRRKYRYRPLKNDLDWSKIENKYDYRIKSFNKPNYLKDSSN